MISFARYRALDFDAEGRIIHYGRNEFSGDTLEMSNLLAVHIVDADSVPVIGVLRFPNQLDVFSRVGNSVIIAAIDQMEDEYTYKYM